MAVQMTATLSEPTTVRRVNSIAFCSHNAFEMDSYCFDALFIFL